MRVIPHHQQHQEEQVLKKVSCWFQELWAKSIHNFHLTWFISDIREQKDDLVKALENIKRDKVGLDGRDAQSRRKSALQKENQLQNVGDVHLLMYGRKLSSLQRTLKVILSEIAREYSTVAF